MNNSNSIDALNSLLARTYDAEVGYKEAAENVESTRLAETFKANAAQRYTFGHEIKECIKSLGGTPKTGQSIAGQMHQAWMNVRSTLANNDETAVLKEVERGEESALETYKETLGALPRGAAYDKIYAQQQQVESIKQRVKELVPVYTK